MPQVAIGGGLKLRERGAVAKRARDLCQRVPTSKRVVHRGQTLCPR